nr:MAG TPA: hypothetical protein [Caudoviricetes sp.]
MPLNLETLLMMRSFRTMRTTGTLRISELLGLLIL